MHCCNDAPLIRPFRHHPCPTCMHAVAREGSGVFILKYAIVLAVIIAAERIWRTPLCCVMPLTANTSLAIPFFSFFFFSRRHQPINHENPEGASGEA
ncbi:hypothetical protein J3F84DRAFT_385640 [Trichoderma pleuroticola]